VALKAFKACDIEVELLAQIEDLIGCLQDIKCGAHNFRPIAATRMHHKALDVFIKIGGSRAIRMALL